MIKFKMLTVPYGCYILSDVGRMNWVGYDAGSDKPATIEMTNRFELIAFNGHMTNTCKNTHTPDRLIIMSPKSIWHFSLEHSITRKLHLTEQKDPLAIQTMVELFNSKSGEDGVIVI